MANATRAPRTSAPAVAVPEVTGYDTDIKYYATRYKQGGRTVYALDLSPLQVIATVAKPDPSRLTPGNRAIRPAHANGFARYFREHSKWVVPGMILRASTHFGFDIITEIEGAEFGVLSFPRRAASEINILDGQHRILGFHLAEDGIAADLDKARSGLASARRVDPHGAVVAEAQKRIHELDIQRDRLAKERVSLQIVVVEDPAEYKQMFFDIADNQLGITGSVKARFDTRKVVNRALESVLEHKLLEGRVDIEADRIGRGSIYFMGAKHVSEVIRSVTVGLDGRVSRRQDAEWKEADVASRAKKFLDILIEAFPPLKAMTLGQVLPDDIRKSSLLGSVLTVRVLAGVYHDLITDHAFTPEMVEAYFRKLAPHMGAPVYPASIWMAHTDGSVFSDGGRGPHSRRQDLKSLKNTLVDWAIEKPKFVDEPPAPRPAIEVEVDPEMLDITEAEADAILRPQTARARQTLQSQPFPNVTREEAGEILRSKTARSSKAKG